MEIRELCREAHANAKEKGFWKRENAVLDTLDDYDLAKGTELWDVADLAFKMQKLMLIASELGEAVEALRNGDQDKFEEELADVFIRLGDFCGGYNIDIETAIRKKMEYNRTRPHMHGKKC